MKPTAYPFQARAARVLLSISFLSSSSCLFPSASYLARQVLCSSNCVLFASITPAFTASVCCLKISRQATPLLDPRRPWPPRSMHLCAPLHPANLPPRLASHPLLLLSTAAFPPSIPLVPCSLVALASSRLFRDSPPHCFPISLFRVSLNSGFLGPCYSAALEVVPTSFLHPFRFSLPPFLLPRLGYLSLPLWLPLRAVSYPVTPTFIPYYLLREE